MAIRNLNLNSKTNLNFNFNKRNSSSFPSGFVFGFRSTRSSSVPGQAQEEASSSSSISIPGPGSGSGGSIYGMAAGDFQNDDRNDGGDGLLDRNTSTHSRRPIRGQGIGNRTGNGRSGGVVVSKEQRFSIVLPP